MKPISGKRMCRVLEAHGFTLHRIKGSHHIYKRPPGPGYDFTTVVPVPVHGNQDLPLGTQVSIMRKADLIEDDL